MFSRTHRFIIKQNMTCCLLAALTMLVIVVLSVAGQPWAPWHWAFIEAPKDYWDRFMPLAQFTAAGGLAYLALEIFRHSNAVAKSMREFFGPTAQDRDGVVKSIEDITMREMEANAQLIIFIYLWQLSDLRGFWGRGSDIGDPRRFSTDAKLVENKLKGVRDLAEKQNWFWYGTGKVYLRHFLKGSDTVFVSFGLGLSVWLHALSAFEGSVRMYVPGFFTSWPFQVLVTLSLLLFGVVLPLYYVFVGRKLMDEIQDISEKAVDQFDARKKELRGKDKGEIKSMLDELKEQIKAAKAEKLADIGHDPSVGPGNLN